MLSDSGDAYCCMPWVLPGLHAFDIPFEEHLNDNLPPRKPRQYQAPNRRLQ